MAQLIYLCRHADYDSTFNQSLTDDGVVQARALGAYLSGCAPNPVFITSTHGRAVNTAKTVAEVMGIGLTGNNHYSFSGLCELFVREFEQECNPCITPERLKAMPSTKDVSRMVAERLEEVGKKHPDNSLIAILHGNINAAFLYEARNKEKEWFEFQMDYCDTWRMEREGSKIMPKVHIPNKFMSASKPAEPDLKINCKNMLGELLSDGFE